MYKTLLEIHQDIPADHYDRGIKNNIFQRLWHSRRFSEVLKVIVPVKGSILDIGCHSGTFTQKILTKIDSQLIYGIDISPRAIALAQKRIPQGIFQVADAQRLPFADDLFQAVFCLEVLEHVDNPNLILSEIKRVLKIGGYGVILVPTESLLFKIIWFLWTLRYPIWRHTHVQSFPYNSLEKLLKRLEFKILSVKTFNWGMLKLVVFEK